MDEDAQVQRCTYGDGDCAIPVGQAVVAIEDGQAFVAGREAIEDHWTVDLAIVDRERELTAEEAEAVSHQVDQRRQAAAGGFAMQLAPLPGSLGQVRRAVIVECSPCGHRFIAQV